LFALLPDLMAGLNEGLVNGLVVGLKSERIVGLRESYVAGFITNVCMYIFMSALVTSLIGFFDP
jgi:hypothetical protein